MAGDKNISQLGAKVLAFHPNDLLILRDFQTNRDVKVTYAQLLTAVGDGNGLSAYAVAVLEGFVGTEEEWLESLVGEKGDDGDSAYQIAVANGFVGTEAAWLLSLKGDAGDDGADGEDGDSAYQIAVANGFVGTEAAWLLSLKGDAGNDGADGEDGDSAYQVAVANGFVGTEAAWLASLKGDQGEPGEAGGIQSVTGDGVDNTDPDNPVITQYPEAVTSTAIDWSKPKTFGSFGTPLTGTLTQSNTGAKRVVQVIFYSGASFTAPDASWKLSANSADYATSGVNIIYVEYFSDTYKRYWFDQDA